MSQYKAVKGAGSYKTVHLLFMKSMTGENMERISRPPCHQCYGDGRKEQTLYKRRVTFLFLSLSPHTSSLSHDVQLIKQKMFTQFFLKNNSIILYRSLIRTVLQCCITYKQKALISKKELFNHTDQRCQGRECYFSLASHLSYRGSNPESEISQGSLFCRVSFTVLSPVLYRITLV